MKLLEKISSAIKSSCIDAEVKFDWMRVRGHDRSSELDDAPCRANSLSIAALLQ